MRIFAEVGEEASIDSGLSRTAILSVFAGYFFGNFRDEASIITQRHVIRCRLFSDPKCMTLSDLEWLLRVKFCIRAGLSGFRLSDRACATFEHNCVKTNKGR